MTLLNFSIGEDFISVIKDGSYLDLHNNFDFINYNYDVANKEFRLVFTKSSGDWASGIAINKLVFTFRGVSFLKIKEGDSSEYSENENCLDNIGFSDFDMRQDMDSFLTLREFQSDYDMIFTFIPGQTIKVHSNEVLLESF